MKQYKVTYRVFNVEFEKVTSSASELFDIVRSIIRKERLMFPDQSETIDGYMKVCADIAFADYLKHENHIFTIEKLESENQ